MKDSTHLDPAITAGAVEQEVARVLDAPVRDGDVVSAMPKVVGPCGLRDFRTAMTSASIGILRHVGDLDSSPSTERQTMRTTGADCPRRFGGRQTSCQFGCAGLLLVAPLCCTKLWQRSQSGLMAVISSDVDDERATPNGRYARAVNQSKKALPAVIASKALQTRSTGLEPAASSVTSWRSRVPNGNLSEVAASGSAVCTSVCTSEPPKRRKRGADAAAVGGVETPAEVKPAPVETDFAAALKMLAMLPLSDEERAEAVRRLLKGGGSAR